MAKGELAFVPLKDIRENPSALRPVDKTTEAYQGLVDSIRKLGVLNPVNVVEVPSDNGVKHYAVMDGLHRYSAAIDAGLEEIPCQIQSRSEAEIYEAQIAANIHKVETKPAQYSNQLNRMLLLNPTLTMNDICSRLSKSITWVSDRMGLVKLKETIQKHVDEGRIKVSNAVALAKLPPELQDDFVERAMTQSPGEFVPAVQSAVKAHRDALRAGRDPNAATIFEPYAFLQKMSDIKEVAANPKALAQSLIAAAQPKNAEEIFGLAIKWVLHLDPKSVDVQRAKFEATLKEKADAKVARAAEREEKKRAALKEQPLVTV